jgi:hypothetical protein
VGALDGNGLFAWPGRILLGLSGVLLALPGNKEMGLTHLQLIELSAVFGVAGVALAWLGRRQAPPVAVS